mmetsp:Transcript_2415/g.3513  ORF Transcript_2415/g.3513 Transcript_2415/m.3513 type:complete len:362 (-) Transcript_2415:237-1322(-)
MAKATKNSQGKITAKLPSETKANPSSVKKKKDKKSSKKTKNATLSQIPSKKVRKIAPSNPKSENREKEVEIPFGKSALDKTDLKKSDSKNSTFENSASALSVNDFNEIKSIEDDDDSLNKGETKTDQSSYKASKLEEQIKTEKDDDIVASADEESKKPKRKLQDNGNVRSKAQKIAYCFLHIKNLPFATKAGEVLELCKKFGSCKVVSYPMHQDKGKGVAVLEFDEIQDLEKASELNKTEFNGRVIKVDKIIERPLIFVRYQTLKTDEEIKSHFSECGAIKSISNIIDQKKKKTSSYRVVFETEEAAWKAMELPRDKVDGEHIVVKLVLKQKRHKKSMVQNAVDKAAQMMKYEDLEEMSIN